MRITSGAFAILITEPLVMLFVAIKQRMEKEVDEVGKVARSIKSKIEELDREVKSCVAYCS